MSSSSLPALIDLFTEDLEQRLHFAPNTVDAYRWDVRHFLAWSDRHGEPLALKPYLLAHSHWTQATMRCRRARLLRFLRFAGQHGLHVLVDDSSLKKGRLSQSRNVLSPAAIGVILARIPDTNPRDALLFRLLYLACLRATEVARLRPVDIQNLSQEAVLLTLRHPRKEATQKRVDNTELVEMIRQYLAGRKPEELMFQPSRAPRSSPLRQQNIHKRWVQYCAAADLHCSLEDLRISGKARQEKGGHRRDSCSRAKAETSPG